MHDSVAGIAASPTRLVAVGSISDVASAWVHRFGDRSWSRAPASAFPPGATVSAITSLSGAFLAAGHVRQVARAQTIIDDRTGRAVVFPVLESVPVIFRSADGRVWERVESAVPGVRWGAFTAIAARGDGSEAIAIGSRFLEPGITEGHGLIAMVTRDGLTWEEAELPGVAPPVHGGPTLLARVGARTLMGTRALRTTALYETSGGRWRRVPAPSPDASYVAAAGTERSFLLAGVDAMARPRFWQRIQGGWRERPDVGASVGGGWLADLESVDGSLIGAGSHDGDGFVRSVGS